MAGDTTDNEFGAVVLLTMGPPGQQMHVAAREVLEAPSTKPGVRWFDVNIQGNHLPQMYADTEAIEVTGPIAVVRHGLCPSCMGWGLVDRLVPVEETGACRTCEGTGRLGLAQTVLRDDSTTEVHVQWDPKDMAEIPCELCRAAFEIRPAG